MAIFASKANKAVAEAVSTEDNPSIADMDKAVTKAASTAEEDVAMIASSAGKAVAEAASTADEASTRRGATG